jgi:ATP-dependent DNA helicase RecG
MILGVSDKRPRRVVGTNAFQDLGRTVPGLLERIRLRVAAEEIQHPNGRVLVFHVPTRPIGVPVHDKGTYWMRSGEELLAMSPDQLKRILDEAQPDFSASICTDATLDDLDPAAIELFRKLWVRKSGNESLMSLPPEQLLTDAELIRSDGIAYAALVLLRARRGLIVKRTRLYS